MREPHRTINRRTFNLGAGSAVAGAAVFPAASVVAQDDEPVTEEVVHYDVSGLVQEHSVGDFTCYAVSDGASLHNDPDDLFYYYNLLFGLSGEEDVAEALEAGGYDKNELIRQDTCAVVQTGEHTVLIDTGFGSGFGGVLASNLAGAGIALDSIDIVVNTHAHPDHIGGNLDESGAPIFPNARYVTGEREWNFWADADQVEQSVPNAAVREVILGFVNAQMTPIADLYELIGFDEEIVPGVYSIESPGHTPGHMSVLVESGDEKLWIAADFATHPVDLQNPSLAGYGDVNPELMESTRRALFQRIADEGGSTLFFHFDPFPGMGTLSGDGDAWSWEPNLTN